MPSLENQDFGVVLSQNYEHGQFVLESARLERQSYERLLEELNGGAAPPR